MEEKLWLSGDESSAPTDISLSNNVLENSLEAGEEIGILSTTDANLGDRFSYELVAGEGDMDNASFYLLNGSLRNAVSLAVQTVRTMSEFVQRTLWALLLRRHLQ